MVYTALRLKQVGSIKFINMHKHLRIYFSTLQYYQIHFSYSKSKLLPNDVTANMKMGAQGRMELCVDVAEPLNGTLNVVRRNGVQVLQTRKMLYSDQVSCARKVTASYMICISFIFYFNIYIQISKTDRSTSSYILAIVNCGSDRMVPECSYCLVNNDTTIHAWCAGNCKYDRIEGTCTEIKGNIKTVIFRFTVMCLKSSGLTIRISEIVFR